MRRKVIQIADSTQLVSLPRKWALAHNLKKGDEVEIEEKGNKLVIYTEKGRGLESIELDITGLDRDSLMFLIRCLYYKGYDEIKLNFKKATTKHHKVDKEVTVISSIHEEVNRLNGVEVIQQKEDYCIIKDISEGNINEFDNVLRRIFLLLIDSSKDLIEGIRQKKFHLIDSINEKHDTITKFIAYNLRLLNKFSYPEEKKTNSLYHIINSIDEIIDLIKYCSRYIISNRINVSKESLSMLSRIHNILSLYHDLHYSFDLKKIERISEDRSQIVEKASAITKKVPASEIFVLTHMSQIPEIIIHLTVTRMALEY